MSLKLRVLPRLPARLLGTTGTTVVKANGVWTVKLDVAPLATVGSVAGADQATTYFVINRDTSYYKISYASLVADVSASVEGGLGFQPLDADLTALAALATTGFIQRTGAATYALSTAINLAAQVTGTLPLANGGTAQTTAAAARGKSADAIIIAEQGRWYTAVIRPLLALPVIIYLWKVIVWDKVLAWGTTDPILGDVGVWAGTILTTYVGGRSLEKIARTIWGRR